MICFISRKSFGCSSLVPSLNDCLLASIVLTKLPSDLLSRCFDELILLAPVTGSLSSCFWIINEETCVCLSMWKSFPNYILEGVFLTTDGLYGSYSMGLFFPFNMEKLSST